MTRVLAFATVPPRRSAVRPYISEIIELGGEVCVACWFEPAAILGEAGAAEIRAVELATPEATMARPARWWPRRKGADALSATDPSTMRWLGIRDDPWVADHATRADFLVAVDQDAVYPVWELARANPGPRACFGLYAVIATLTGRMNLSVGEAGTAND
jgi:hypothetical protein